MTGLERAYRGLLGLFPPGYRARRGDELLGTLLDAAPSGRRAPRPADVADLVRAAGLAWLRAAATPRARTAWRDGLATGAALLLVLLSAYAGFAATRLATLGAGHPAGPGTATSHGPVARAAGVLLLAAWPLALWWLAAGRTRRAALTATAGAVAAAAWVLVQGARHDAYLPLHVLVALGACAATPPLALVLAGSKATPKPGRTAIRAALAVATVAGAATAAGLPAVAGATAVALAATTLLASATRVRATALATAALPLLGVALGTLADRLVTFDEPRPGPAVDLAEAVGHWDFGLPLAVAAAAWLAALYGVARSSA